jgi:hypothetical protein
LPARQAHVPDKLKESSKYVHPIHGVWPIIGLLGILAARFYLPMLPSSILKCPSRTLFGFRCPGCGSGSAIVALSEFRFVDALIANPLFLLGGLALSIWGALASIGHFIGKPLPKWDTTNRRKDILRYGLIAALLLNWIYEAFIWPI